MSLGCAGALNKSLLYSLYFSICISVSISITAGKYSISQIESTRFSLGARSRLDTVIMNIDPGSYLNY